MGGMWLWWLLGIAIIGALAWVVVKAPPGNSRDNEPTPEELLKRRYAQGDIDKDDYEKRLRDLRQ